MENKQRLKPYIPLLASLLLGLALFFLVDDFIVAVVVMPVLRVAWFLSLVLNSIPQGVQWVGFILVMLIVIFLMLRVEKDPNHPAASRTIQYTGTVERWARLIEYSRNSRYSKWRLAQGLRRLTQRLSAERQDEMDNDLAGLDLPQEIRTYFEAQQPSGYGFRGPFAPVAKEPGPDLNLDPEEVIQYLERRFSP